MAVINKAFTRNYSGGLIKYLDNLCEAYSGLENVGNTYTEKQKILTLMNNLHLDSGDQYLKSYCRNNYKTFKECVTYLRGEATIRSKDGETMAKRKANLTISNDINSSTTKDEVDMAQRFLLLAIKDKRFLIPRPTWNIMVKVF